MQPTLPCLAATALCAVASAQSVTSPIGLELTEGSSYTTVLFGPTDRRLQQIDMTLIGAGARVFNSLSFRRDGSSFVPSATARTVDIEVAMGHGDPTTPATGVFDGNYVSPATIVRARQAVNFPDWTSSTPAPAPFDLVLTFDAPFAYNGIDPLVWEVTVKNSSSFGLVYTDSVIAQTPFGTDTGVVRDSGCTVTGETVPFECAAVSFNFGPSHPLLGQRIIFSASGAPPDTAVAIDICLPTPPLMLPGLLCGPFQSDLVVTLSMGASSPTGYTTDFTVDVEYNPLLDGVQLASQALSIDPGQPGLPIVLSDIRVITLPPPVSPLDCSYIWAGAEDSIGTLYPNRGVVALLQ